MFFKPTDYPSDLAFVRRINLGLAESPPTWNSTGISLTAPALPGLFPLLSMKWPDFWQPDPAVAWLLTALLCRLAAPGKPAQFQAGASKVDLTPPPTPSQLPIRTLFQQAHGAAASIKST